MRSADPDTGQTLLSQKVEFLHEKLNIGTGTENKPTKEQKFF
jgi:hypothetical protein